MFFLTGMTKNTCIFDFIPIVFKHIQSQNHKLLFLFFVINRSECFVIIREKSNAIFDQLNFFLIYRHAFSPIITAFELFSKEIKFFN